MLDRASHSQASPQVLAATSHFSCITALIFSNSFSFSLMISSPCRAPACLVLGISLELRLMLHGVLVTVQEPWCHLALQQLYFKVLYVHYGID